MHLITKRLKIKNVATRWSASYGNGKYGIDKLDILKRLETLDGDKATVDDITSIIGNDSWTSIECAECINDVDEAIEFDNYEEHTIFCKSCLSNALGMFNE